MIKNIVFDMGNVLIDFSPKEYLSEIIEDPLVVEKVYQEMFCHSEWSELDRGAVSEDEALASISARIPAYKEYVKHVMTTWFKKLKPIEGMFELVRDLRQQGYQIYLLSNASPRIYEYMHNIPAIQFFDGYLISCDIRVNKPDLKIYQSLMCKYDLIAEECIFIDDLARNVDGAKAAGWQGYVFKGAVDLRHYFIEKHILYERGEMLIRIRPHHFMDIIKLYGKGIEVFVPDPQFNHHFYLVANEILKNHQVSLKIIVGRDDICLPCNRLGQAGECTDPIKHISGVHLKNEWNNTLDNRIIKYSNAFEDSIYSAQEYCKMLYDIKEHIFDIWEEESDSAKNERYHYFCNGARKYLGV